jgi:hypothetical protein
MINLKTSIQHSERQAWIAVSTSTVLMVVVKEARGESKLKIGLRSLVRKMASKKDLVVGEIQGPAASWKGGGGCIGEVAADAGGCGLRRFSGWEEVAACRLGQFRTAEAVFTTEAGAQRTSGLVESKAEGLPPEAKTLRMVAMAAVSGVPGFLALVSGKVGSLMAAGSWSWLEAVAGLGGGND